MPFASRSSSAKIHDLVRGLQLADKDLKSGSQVDGSALRELRDALDKLRMTAWTVSEVQNARETSKDAHAVISFLTAERLRRFRQMINDFCADIDHEGVNWPSTSLYDLQEAVSILRERLGLLTFRLYSTRSAGENK